ncbi:MAG TPA: L,D-transpeptidase, partial [Xanthobacteraceae bacterium]|nr:L,D-transpeptidase [Xanthobacteraceae bacterium]
MLSRFLACLAAAACVLTANAALAAPAGKSRNYDHTVQTTDPLGRFFGASVSPVGRTTVSYPGNHRPGTVVINTRERRLYL